MKRDTSPNLVNLSIRPIPDHLDELKYPCRILEWKWHGLTDQIHKVWGNDLLDLNSYDVHTVI